MKQIDILLTEYNRYGGKEVYYHLLHRMMKSESSLTAMLRERDRQLSLYSINQLVEVLTEQYFYAMNEKLNLEKPQTFTEKIQWIKIYGDTEGMQRLADKYEVRKWIGQTIGEQYLIPLIGSFEAWEEIDFTSLPRQFCMKMNHGSGMNYIVTDKEKLDFEKIKRNFDAWAKRSYYAETIELQYQHMKRRILVERYIEELDGQLYDYKFHCFNGKPEFIQCIGERDLKKHTGYQNNFSLEWEKLDWTFEDYPEFPYVVKKPQGLELMIEIANKLSENFLYVRVDLYEVKGKVFFGEMTFTPASGFYPYHGTWTRKKNEELGQLININE